jgi:hypothetical protein
MNFLWGGFEVSDVPMMAIDHRDRLDHKFTQKR